MEFAIPSIHHGVIAKIFGLRGTNNEIKIEWKWL